MALYLDDFAPGQVFEVGSYEMTADVIMTFAKQWDPQYFHTDEEAAKNSFFGGLAASGWHTACATMSMMARSGMQPANGLIGTGIDNLKWHRPVRPGDVLSVRIEVLEVRAMQSRPDLGLVKTTTITLDAAGQPVQSFDSSMVVAVRPAA